MLDRRRFLTGAVTLLASTALPVPSMATAAAEVAPVLPSWAVGTAGEYDWLAIVARTAEEAVAIWRKQNGFVPEDGDLDLDVKRVPRWDGIADPGAKDWLAAGFDYTCARCGDGGVQDGAIVDDEPVCGCCMTILDWAKAYPEHATERLTDLIFEDGDDEVRAELVADGTFEQLPAGMWDRAAAEAAKWLSEDAGDCPL